METKKAREKGAIFEKTFSKWLPSFQIERKSAAQFSFVFMAVVFLCMASPLVANAAPVQSAWSPASGSYVNSTSPTVTLSLNVNGDCKWSTTNQDYTSMTGDCTGDGSKNISCSVSGLPEGAVSVYTACRQTSNGHYDTPHLLSYTVDTIAPTGGSVTYTDGWITTTSATITFNKGTDATSGIASVQLQWQNATLSSGTCGTYGSWANNGTQTLTSTSRTDSLTSGRCYIYRYVVTDNAGNIAYFTSASVLKVDTSKPSTIGTVNDGTAADISTTNNGTQLSANWTASTDSQSGILKYWYAIGTTSGGTNIVGWTDNALALSVTTTGLSLTDGITYYVSVRSQNGAGRYSNTKTSNGQKYVDNTPPIQGPWSPATGACIATKSPTVTLTMDETGDCKWSLTDQAYASMSGNCTGDGTVSASCGVSGLVEGTDWIYISCRDLSTARNADTSGTNTGGSYIIDTVSPSGGFLTYTNGYISTTSTNITLGQGTDASPSSGITSVQLKRDTATLSAGSCGAFPGSWLNTGSQWPGDTLAVDSTLVPGYCYKYRYTVTDCSGNATDFDGTSILKVDAEAPVNGSVVYTDGFINTTSVDISLDQGVDAESGIASVQLQRDSAMLSGGNCGAYSGTWSNIGTQVPGVTTATDATLASGNCYIYRYRVLDTVGNIALFDSTDELKVDTSAPTGGSVSYTNGYITITSATINFNQGTTPSGIASVQLQRDQATLTTGTCGSYSGTWANIGTQTPGDTSAVDATLTSGNCYKYRYVVTDNSSNTSVNTSASVLKVDTSAPATIASVNDGTGADIAFTISSTQLSANWPASSDAQSGIAKYWYAIGTAAGGTDIVNWTNNALSLSVTKTGLSLTSGQIYYFSVKAENAAVTQSALTSSNGQTVDTDAPTGGSVTYTNGFISVTTINITLNQGIDPLSGIASVQLKRDQATLTDGVCGAYSGSWLNIGTQSPGAVSATDATLLSGKCYKYRYVVTDNVGNVGTFNGTSVLRVDTSGPSGGSITYDDGLISTTTTDITFDEGDAASGVLSVQLQRDEATLSNNSCGSYSGSWTNIGTQVPGDTAQTDATLVTGKCYIYQLNVTDNSSNTEMYVSTSVLMVDTTAPSTASVNDGTGADISYTNSLTQLSANWTAFSDAQSGIAGYWYAIGTTAGGTDITGWTDYGPSLSITKTGLSLTNEQTYYFSVKAENNVGILSAAASSNGQTVDLTPPAGGSITYPQGFYSDYTVTITFDQGTDALSGIASVQLQRDEAVGPGICGPFADVWTDIGTQVPGDTSEDDSTIVPGNCHRYRYMVTDSMGNVVYYTANYHLIVDHTLPSGGSITYADGYTTLSTIDITFDEGTANSGYDSVQLQRDEATLSADVCGAYSGTWTDIGTQSPGDTMATDATLASDMCYIYRYTVIAKNGKTGSFTNASVVKVDFTAPVITAVLPASDIYSTSTSVSSGGTTCTDAGAGLDVAPYDIQWCDDGVATGGCDASATWSDTAPAGWSSTNSESFTGVDGTWYRFRASCRDAVGNVSGWTYSAGYILVDASAPDNPTVAAYDDSSKTTSLISNSAYSYNGPGSPYFEWTAPSDNPSSANSGVAGYYVYFGTSASAEPTSFQTGLTFTNSATLTNGTKYYLRIKTEDNAGNISTASTVFTYTFSGGSYLVASEVDSDGTLYGTDLGNSDGEEGVLAPDDSDFEIVRVELLDEWDQLISSASAGSLLVTITLSNTGSSGAYIASTDLGGATTGGGVTTVTGTLHNGKGWIKVKANGTEQATSITVIPSNASLVEVGGRNQEAHILIRDKTGINIAVVTVDEDIFAPASGETVMNPVWNHNGDEVVFSSTKNSPDNGWNIYKLKWNGSGWDTVVKLTNNGMCVQPHSKYTFSADDSMVLFAGRSSCSASTPAELYAVNTDGTDSTKTLAELQTAGKKLSDVSGYTMWDASWSNPSCSTNAGKLLVALSTPSARGDLELYTLSGAQNASGLFTLSGSTMQQITNIGGISSWSMMGEWSADCSKIVFVTWVGYGSPTYTSIYVIDLNTASLPVTSLSAAGVTKVHECSSTSCTIGPALYPSFSADSSMVSYMADPSKSMNLYSLIIPGTSFAGQIAANFFGAAGVNFNNYIEYIPDQPIFSPQLLGQSENNEYGLVQCVGPACPNSSNGNIFSYITQKPGQRDGKLSFLELSNESSVTSNGGLLFFNGSVTAVFPPGSVVQGEVKLQATDPGSAPTTTDLKDLIVSTGEARDFFPNGVVFSKDIRLIFNYCDADADGFLDVNQDVGCTGGGNSTIDENKLYVYYWCESISSVGCEPGTWIKLAGHVDRDADIITVITNHFSLYDMKALTRGRYAPQQFVALELLGIRTYPNPWKTTDGNLVFTADTASTYNTTSTIQVTVDIYDIRGKSVRRLLAVHTGTIPTDFNGLSLAKWDARNNAGKQVASGVYPYMISVFDGVFRKHYEGKLSIVR